MADLVLPAGLAVWDPLGGTPEPSMTGHDVVCVHTMAGTFVGTDAYFHQDGWHGTESTVGIAGSGFCKQWTPWNRQADANLEGNPRVLSIECADMGEGFSGSSDEEPPLTAAQLDRIVRLCVFWCDKRNHQVCPSWWRCHTEGIPARFIANSCERGIGTHYHGIYGRGLVDGCPIWSTSKGKLCPRMVRHRQVRDLVVPEVKRRLEGAVGGLFVHLTEAEEQEILSSVRDLKRQRQLAWIAATPESRTRGACYFVDGFGQSKIEMTIGGPLHESVKALQAVTGLPVNARDVTEDDLPPTVPA